MHTISEQLGLNYYIVRNVLIKNMVKIRPNVQPKLSEKEKHKIIKLYESVLSNKAVAKQLGHCSKTTAKVLREHGIELIRRNQRIFKEDYQDIVKLYLCGKKTKEIAKVYNCSSHAILDVLHKHRVPVDVYRPTAKDALKWRKHSLNQNYFKNLDTNEKGYWAGFLGGDAGFQRRANNDVIGITITLRRSDKRHIEKLLKALESGHPITETSYEIERKGNTKTIKCVRTDISSKVLAEGLMSVLNLDGSIAKSYSLEFPILPRKLERSFIRGILDADGCIRYEHKQRAVITFYGTKSICEGVRRILVQELCVNEVKIKKNHTSKHLFEVTWTGRGQVLKILDWLYKDADIYLDRKFEKYKSIPREKSYVDITRYLTATIIKEYRKENKLRQIDLAKVIGVSLTTIYEMESSIRNFFKTSTVKKLCSLLELEYRQSEFDY